MEKSRAVLSFTRPVLLTHRSPHSRRITKNPLHALAIALIVGVSTPAWCAPDTLPKTPATRSASPKLGRVININTADATTLAELKGIGPAKAKAIVDYRRQHGPFKSVEQLADVKGIGEILIAKNRNRMSAR